MPKIIENEIEFDFKHETVMKYDETNHHKRCKGSDKKGVDFLYKVDSNLLLIEVKDYNTNISKKTNTEIKKITKDRENSLDREKETPYKAISSNIEQKFNDTLLHLFSSTLHKNNKTELKEFLTQIEKITLILIIDLPYELQGELDNIETKLNQKLKKIKCIFNIDFLILNSKSELNSLKMNRVLPKEKKKKKSNSNLLHIYDSVKKTKLPFESIIPNKASIYVCGPTVYDDAHLGHARSSLSFDLLARTLKALNYEVTMGKNFTDIDDKIIKKVQESGQSLEEITTHYINRYQEDMRALGVTDAEIEPKATESLEAMESMIQGLIDKDIAYVVSSGDVYFDTSKDKRYGTISHQVGDDEDNQSRVEHNAEKRNPKDFALWKACHGEEDICFETSFSKGRPGWHIECSAMIEKHFEGTEEYSIDIHGGGADLLFPHHENEATQSRCATGHEVAKYWMHNGFVNMNGEKMSKSLGNSFFVKDALKEYDGEILRNYLISIHYRNDFNFNEEDLLNSKKRLDKLYRLKKRVTPTTASKPNIAFKKTMMEAMSDDLNISVALATIEEMISNTNDKFDENPKDKGLKKETLANIEFIAELLGIGGKEPFSYFQIGIDEETKAHVEQLIKDRDEAKKEKDYAKSDAIRDKIKSMGISIMDTANGTVWEKI